MEERLESSLESLKIFLDKDGIMDLNGNLYIVVGNNHPEGGVISYVKYVKTTEDSPWRDYKRVVKKYGVNNILNLDQKYIYDPCQGVTLPYIPLAEVRMHYNPVDSLHRVLRSPRDKLEADVVKLVDGIGISKGLGVTGSLMFGIQHHHSDIDFIIYGCKRALDFLETFEGFEADNDWLSEASSTYNLADPRYFYDKRRRGVYMGRKFSFSFVDTRAGRFCKDVCKNVGYIEAEVFIEPNQCGSLFNPIRVEVKESTTLLGDRTLIDYVTSYEGIYSVPLFRGGKMIVGGLLRTCDGHNEILIGDRKVGGFVKGVL